MKKLLFVSIVFYGLFFISCNNNPNTTETPISDTLSDQEVKAVFDSATGKTVGTTDTIPKYKTEKNNIAGKADNFYVLSTEIPASCVLPTKIGDLIGGVDFKIYKFDQNASASASAMGFSGEIGKKQMLFIQDFIRYDYITCGGKETKVGIGLRCFIHVTSFKGKLAYSSLPGIAANVQLEKAKCSFELKALGFGIDGSVLAEGLQAQGDYNVENFGKLAIVFNNVLKLLNANSTMKIRPVELPN